MADLRTLVVYYSRSGTTKRVAEAIAEALGADVEEVIDKKRRAGALGFVVAGKDAARKKLTEIEPPTRDPSLYELVVVGTPVWAATVSCAIRTYLSQNKDRLPGVAFFLTTGGSGIERTFEHMAELCGKDPLARLALKAKQVRADEWRDQVASFAQELTG